MEQLIYINVIDFPSGNLEPVRARLVHGSCFEILDENDDDEHFPWEFSMGELVTCEEVTFCENETGLVAKYECRCAAI